MSVPIPHHTCTPETLAKLDRDLHLTITPPSRPGMPKRTVQLQPYRVQAPFIYVPFAYGVQNGYIPMAHRPLTTPIQFQGVLRDEQKVARAEILEALNTHRSVIVATHVGFGKSILATYFAYKTQLKTLIVVNRLVLLQQWTEVLQRFLVEPRIHVLRPNTVADWEADFFIVNAINLPKCGYMPEIGLLVVDEVHLIVSKVLSTCFQYVTPTYLMGLSATPYRNDGMDVLLDLYFGPARIVRQLNRAHMVYTVETGFTPTIQLQANGKVDWNDVLNQQALHPERNQRIVDTICRERDRHFLVLCKRVEQIRLLDALLQQRGIHAVCLFGDRQPDTTPPAAGTQAVLIGTIQKVGTGVDAPYLNALVVASDLEAYFIQYLGRVFRRLDIVPVVYDFVDNHPILKKHYRTRAKTYKQHGGRLVKT